MATGSKVNLLEKTNQSQRYIQIIFIFHRKSWFTTLGGRLDNDLAGMGTNALKKNEPDSWISFITTVTKKEMNGFIMTYTI